MKRSLIIAVLFICLAITRSHGQVYDGITQPTKYRVWLPVTTATTSDVTPVVAPFVGYRAKVGDRVSITPVVQYNINNDALSPQIWLNFNVQERYYLLSRSIYNIATKQYSHTLSSTIKLPNGFMVDATWSNIYAGDRFLANDRLQVLCGYSYKWVVFNVGYSLRHSRGVVSNLRLKITQYNWLQFRYDSGDDTFAINVALQFN